MEEYDGKPFVRNIFEKSQFCGAVSRVSSSTFLGRRGHDGYWRSLPHPIERGQGPQVGLDGNEYIDYGLAGLAAAGPLAPRGVEALVRAAPQGSHYGSPVESVLEWGERVCNLMPSADKVRFVGSGAEATSLAMRVARAYTGKEKIVRWQSHYHGWHDYVMPGNLAPFDVPSSTGIRRARGLMIVSHRTRPLGGGTADDSTSPGGSPRGRCVGTVPRYQVRRGRPRG